VIVRVLRGKVSARNASQLWASLAERMSGIGPPAGQRGAIFGRQIHNDGSESFVYVTTWDDMEAVYEWVGGRDLVSTARLMHDLEDLMDDFEVQHFLGSNMATAWALDTAEAVGVDRQPMAAPDPEPSAGHPVH
jgi:heme-degrading monooxygenase HmoA